MWPTSSHLSGHRDEALRVLGTGETGKPAGSLPTFTFISIDKQKDNKEGRFGPNSNMDAVLVEYGCHPCKCPQLHLFWGERVVCRWGAQPEQRPWDGNASGVSEDKQESKQSQVVLDNPQLLSGCKVRVGRRPR